MIATTTAAFVVALAGAAPNVATTSTPALPPCPSKEDAPDVAKLVERTEAMMRGKSMTATMTMSMKTSSYQRSLKMKVWSKGDDYALVRVVEGGPRETGMMTLKREKQLWNYLPQAGRVMKLPSGMLGDSWMGSDFTNDDLVRGSNLAKDFTAKVNGVVDVDGKKAWDITLVPTKDAVVVWGKIEMLVDRATCFPVREQFFDENGKAARTMTFADVKQIGWRTVAMTTIIKPADSARETSVHYDDVAFDVDVPDDTFSVHRLEQGR